MQSDGAKEGEKEGVRGYAGAREACGAGEEELVRRSGVCGGGHVAAVTGGWGGGGGDGREVVRSSHSHPRRPRSPMPASSACNQWWPRVGEER